jgi:hypothetical protein
MTEPEKTDAPAAPGAGEQQLLSKALLAAAYDRNTAGVEALLRQGADVAARHEETGLTALHIAIGTNNMRLTRLLVEVWKAPFTPDGQGRMPTLIAAECQASDALSDYILEQEAKLPDSEGY